MTDPHPAGSLIRRSVTNSWSQILIAGTLLYFLGIAIFAETSNMILFPLVSLVGSFTVPVSYVAFFYERRRGSCVSLSTLILTFLFGGVLGAFAASLLEPVFVQRFGLLSGLQIGIIEELAKILGVILVVNKRRETTELDGILLGAAAGMGFAAFESNGYTFVSFMQSSGNLWVIAQITVVRGLLAPIGHGTWTAILGASLLRDAKREKNTGWDLIVTYLGVSVLHGLWDDIPLLFNRIGIHPTLALAVQLLVGLVSLVILARIWKRVSASPLQSDGQPTCSEDEPEDTSKETDDSIS